MKKLGTAMNILVILLIMSMPAAGYSFPGKGIAPSTDEKVIPLKLTGITSSVLSSGQDLFLNEQVTLHFAGWGDGKGLFLDSGNISYNLTIGAGNINQSEKISLPVAIQPVNIEEKKAEAEDSLSVFKKGYEVNEANVPEQADGGCLQTESVAPATSKHIQYPSIAAEDKLVTSCDGNYGLGGCTGYSCSSTMSKACSTCSSINPFYYPGTCTPPACSASYPYDLGVVCSSNGACNGCSGAFCEFACSYQQLKCTRTCVKNPCTNPSYPNYCGGGCWSSCSSVGAYGGKCCNNKWMCCSSSSNPNLCCPESGDAFNCASASDTCLSNGCSAKYPNKCNGKCWSCSSESATLCCPSSGDPKNCCGSNQICQSDGTCLTPECASSSDCPSDGYYCSGDKIMSRDYSCSSYKCKFSESLYKDCNDHNQWVCVDSDTRAYADYACTSNGCDYSLTNNQDCAYGCLNGECVTSTTVHGYMKYSDGSGVEGAGFKLEDCSTGNVAAYDYTDGSGHYSMSANTGNYVLSVDYLERDVHLTECHSFYGDVSVNDITLSASVSGYVNYSSGSGRSGVITRLKECSGSIVDQETTDNNGYYSLSDPDAGYYKITMELYGYELEVFPCQPMFYGMTAPDVIFGASLSGYIKGSSNNGKQNMPVDLTDCNGKTIDAGVTDSSGYFKVEAADAGYFDFYFKFFNYKIQALDCKAIVGNAQFAEPIVLYATLHGYLRDLNNNPLSGYAWEMYSCSDEFIAKTQTDASGAFSISEDAGKYKIKIAINGGYRLRLVDQNNNDCFLLLGHIDIGTLKINPNPDCSVFNYKCYEEDIKLYGCYFNADEGCVCYGTKCLYGCTDGRPQCDTATERKVIIDVDDKNGLPLEGAKVYLDNIYKGTTDSLGKKTMSTANGYRQIKVLSPDDSGCGIQSTYVTGDTYLYFDCNYAYAPQVHDLRIKITTPPFDGSEEGYRIANVNVWIDNNEKGTTNQFGLLDIMAVEQGTREIKVCLNIALGEDEEPQTHCASTNFNVNEDFSEKTFIVQKAEYGTQASAEGQSITPVVQQISDDSYVISLSNDTLQPEIAPIIIGAVLVAGFIWDLSDYTKCATGSKSWWKSIGEYTWSKVGCLPHVMNKNDLDDCNKKFESIHQNELEKCKVEAAFVASNFIPLGGIISKGGKVAVKIGKLIKTVPHIDDAVGSGFRVIEQNDEIVKIAKGSEEFTYKITKEGIKLSDNIAGMVVDIARRAGVSDDISEKVINSLRNAKIEDIPQNHRGSVDSIHGMLGEKAGDEYIDVVKKILESEQAVVKKISGKAGDVYAESTDYVFKYKDTGDINIFWKTGPNAGQNVGEVDRLIFVNDKPVVFEIKSSLQSTFKKQIGSNELYENKLAPIKQLTGKDPEFVLVVPKGEAAKAVKQISDMTNGLKKRGIRSAVDEFPVTVDDFRYEARWLFDQSGGWI